MRSSGSSSSAAAGSGGGGRGHTGSDIPGRCPTPIELGNSGWNILHSAAAVYPYNPSPEQRDAMQHFIYSFSYVYACNWCAYHMRTWLKDHPPDVTNKLTVTRFICEFHNVVNNHLGKEEYDCDPMKVLRRWHPGYPDNMGDKPSMEERMAAAQAAGLVNNKHNTTNHSSATTDGKQPGAAPGTNTTNRPPKDARDWRDGPKTAGAGPVPPHTGSVSSPPLAGVAVRGNGGEEGGTANATVEGKGSWRWWPFGGTPSNGVKGPAHSDNNGSGGGAGSGNNNGWPSAGSTTTTTPSTGPVAGWPPVAGGSGGRPKPPDNETDVDEVLRRLRMCQVYCPEEEEAQLKQMTRKS